MLKPGGPRASDALKKASKVGKANCVGKMWAQTAKAGEQAAGQDTGTRSGSTQGRVYQESRGPVWERLATQRDLVLKNQ